MNEFQFKLVKLFLDGFHVPPKKLAKAWHIDLPLVMAVVGCTSYEQFSSMPDEDLLNFFGVFNHGNA